jgi:hypothetical protein
MYNINKYLLVIIVLIVIMLILIMYNYKQYDKNMEYMENISGGIKEYANSSVLKTGEKQKTIRLRWVNPVDNDDYYLGVIPKNRIDKNCVSFDFNNMSGVTVKADHLLVLVKSLYIQKDDCGDKCISSMIPESCFNFVLTEYTPANPNLNINATYTLTHVPKNDVTKKYIVTLIKKFDDVNKIGQITAYTPFFDYLAIVDQNDSETRDVRTIKSINTFEIEQIFGDSNTFQGIKIFFNKVPVFDCSKTSILASAKKYVGKSVIYPCNNFDCTLDCKSNTQCIAGCPNEYKYLYLYDQILDSTEPTKTNIITFIPEFSDQPLPQHEKPVYVPPKKA